MGLKKLLLFVIFVSNFIFSQEIDLMQLSLEELLNVDVTTASKLLKNRV